MSQLIKQSHASTGVPLWTPAGSGSPPFVAEYPDIWAGSPPTSSDDAINRLSLLLYARTVAGGTLAELIPQSKILIETNNSGGNDVYVVKYTTDGIPLWNARVGGTLADAVNSVATDSLGNVYITGSYASSPLTIFNADGTIFGTLANSGSDDIFVVKYNTTGVAQWGTRLAGTGSDRGLSISTDSAGNVYVGGTYASSPLTIFNADGTTFGTLANSGSNDICLVKYNTTGVAQWGTRLAGTGNDGISIGLSVSSDGTFYITASYNSNPLTIFNSDGTTFGTLANSGSFDACLVKYNTSGFGQWATRVAGTENEGGDGVSIQVGNTGNVYISGVYGSNPLTIFNADGTTFGTLANSGNNDIYLIKYNTSGFGQWATRIGGTGSDGAGVQGLSLDSAENIYFTTVYISPILTIFNSDGTTFGTLVNGGLTNDSCLIKYNTSGFGQWATRQSGSGIDFGIGVSVDSAGNVYQVGTLGSTLMVFNADGSLYTTLANAGGFDGFVVKYNTNGFGVWSTTIGGSGSDNTRGVSVNSTGVYITGNYASVPLYIRSAGL